MFLPPDPPFAQIIWGCPAVRLEKVEQHPRLGIILHVSGADLMDGTPVFDIKPYLPYVESHPGAAGGFTDQIERSRLAVEFPEELLEKNSRGTESGSYRGSGKRSQTGLSGGSQQDLWAFLWKQKYKISCKRKGSDSL